VLIVAVVDAAQTEAVLFGPQGAAAALPPGASVLLCPTIGPPTSKPWLRAWRRPAWAAWTRRCPAARPAPATAA
jgi:hypothetical protein